MGVPLNKSHLRFPTKGGSEVVLLLLGAGELPCDRLLESGLFEGCVCVLGFFMA